MCKYNPRLPVPILLALAAAFVARAAFADVPQEPPVPYNSYNYGVWDFSVPATPVYQPEGVINGWDLGIGDMKNPKDLCRDAKGNVCILDNGNKRIVIVDEEMRLVSVIDRFFLDGEEVELVDPEGICTDAENRLYVADRGAKAVLVAEPDGKVLRRITKPVTDLIDQSTEFLPMKLLVDEAGVLYVLSFGSFEGAYTFDGKGDFLGFFGSNRVYVNAKLRSDRFWRFFATEEQRARMYRYVPVEYANFAIDGEGFIYTVSNFGDNEQRGQVRKLNPLSQNILFAGRKPFLMFFGDWETTYTNRVEKSSLIAVDVDGNDFINVLDFERGRVFQYDQMCNLIAIFGGPGNQNGAFKTAADLVSLGDDVLVLDEMKASLTRFSLTRYGQAIHEATVLYEDGEYEAALVPWFEALKMDRNNHLTMRGIGRAYERLGRYEEAMSYFKLAQYHGSYSDSFREARTEFLRSHFALVATSILAILALPFVVSSLRKRFAKKDEARVKYVSRLRFPFHLVLHPFKGWEELKKEGKGSLLAANLILAATFLMSVVSYQWTGFVFNFNKLDEMNLLINLASTIGIFFLFAVANWGVCTLQNGKGTFKEIWIFTAYARMTGVLATIPLVIISNLLAQEEGLFLTMGIRVVDAWSAVQVGLAVMAVHQYTLKHTLWSVFLTLLGIVLIVIVIALFFSLFSQFFGFLSTVFQEILLRL